MSKVLSGVHGSALSRVNIFQSIGTNISRLSMIVQVNVVLKNVKRVKITLRNLFALFTFGRESLALDCRAHVFDNLPN